MERVFGIGIMVAFGATLHAQSINVRGKVTGSPGLPVGNAVVTLALQGLKDTTGADGAYSLTRANSALERPPLVGGISLEHGLLRLTVARSAPVTVEVFGLRGNALLRDVLPKATAGVYAWDLADNAPSGGLVFIKASIGNDARTFRYLPLGNGGTRGTHAVAGFASARSYLAKAAGVVDTLRITAAGYASKSIPIGTWDTTLNVVLAATGSSAASIQLIGNKIYDTAGNPIVARGPELGVASASHAADVDAIAASGANAMRMLLTLNAANGMTPQAFDAVLGEAVAKHMLVWLSLYVWNSPDNYQIGSALGGGNFYSLAAPAGTGTCSASTPGPCYLAMWSRQWLKDLADKYRANLIIDAAQEFIGTADAGSEAGRTQWATAAQADIRFFRSQGYTNPLEIMANFQGRDLYGIVQHGQEIRASDSLKADGYPQTMFGWQAYWGTTDGWYPKWQGPLLAGGTSVVTGPQAIHAYAAAQPFPIEIGIDNYAADTNLDWQSEIDQCAADAQSWLWWSWKNGTGDVECPASGSTCQSYVMQAANGFAGAKPLSK